MPLQARATGAVSRGRRVMMNPRLIIAGGGGDEDVWDAPLPEELVALLRSEAARVDATVTAALGPTPTGEPRVSPAVLAVEVLRAALTQQARTDEGIGPRGEP
jgi:hypothetical protein